MEAFIFLNAYLMSYYLHLFTGLVYLPYLIKPLFAWVAYLKAYLMLYYIHYNIYT